MSLSSDGGTIRRPPSALAVFEGGLFQASIDARNRRAWARDSFDAPSERWWSTQGRWIASAMRLCGIASSMSDRLREEIASILGVPVMIIRDESRKTLCGYVERGTAVCRVLAETTRARSLAQRLLFAGFRVGLWGEPLVWDPCRRAFSSGGTAAPT